MSPPSEDKILQSSGGNKSYVKRIGHFTQAQQRAYSALSAEFLVLFQPEPADCGNFFGNSCPVIAEIGFGMGGATAIIAAENPGINYLCIEVHKPGIGKLLWEIGQRSLSNIRIIEYDAVDVFVKMLKPRSLDGIHLFFPDPWPKKRHNKRRLVTSPFTDVMASRLKPGGYLYMVTDWEDYAQWALAQLTAAEGLTNTAADGFSRPLSWRPSTGFEKKGLAKNHKVKELYFIKHEEQNS